MKNFNRIAHTVISCGQALVIMVAMLRVEHLSLLEVYAFVGAISLMGIEWNTRQQLSEKVETV